MRELEIFVYEILNSELSQEEYIKSRLIAEDFNVLDGHPIESLESKKRMSITYTQLV